MTEQKVRKSVRISDTILMEENFSEAFFRKTPEPSPQFERKDLETREIERAVEINDVLKLTIILNELERTRKLNIFNNAQVKQQPILIHAVVGGYRDIVKVLLQNGINLFTTNTAGRTALHEAVRTGNAEMIQLLISTPIDTRDETDGLSKYCKRELASSLALESVSALASNGVLINVQDRVGLTPMLLLTEASSLSTEQFTTLVKVLLKNGANPEQIHPGNGQTILFRAIEMEAEEACKDLINAGVSLNLQDTVGNTVLHFAAKLDLPTILSVLLRSSKKSVNVQNKDGDTALHCAAIAGARDCITVLLDNGGDLSTENNECQTVLDTIYFHLPRPSSFLIEMLNSKVLSNGCAINDRKFQLTLDFRVLSPDRTKQMAVVVALMNTLHQVHRKNILSHPLIETYIRAKWRKLRIFFFALVFLHLLFVFSLSTHVIWTTYPEDVLGVTWSRRVLLVTATCLMIHVLVQTFLAPRYFLHEAETWLSLTCVCLSFVVAMSGELLTAKSDNEWTRHMASYTILLAWGQIMFTLGRFPAVGFFALMFFTVLKNVIKVLLISACLVFGFALSFCLQFNSFEYEGVWRSLIRTTVMLMGEYQYENLFPATMATTTRRWDDKPSHLNVTSHIIFLLFILLGSIVLVNLMIGLAVNDIQGLQVEGNLRHMIKQAEFLLHMDTILSFFKFRGRKAPSMVTLSPNTTHKMRENHYRMLGINIPNPVMEGLVEIALKNQRKGSDVSTDPPSSTYRTSNKLCHDSVFLIET